MNFALMGPHYTLNTWIEIWLDDDLINDMVPVS